MVEFLLSNQLQFLGMFALFVVIVVVISNTKERYAMPSSIEISVGKENISSIQSRLGILIPLFTNYSETGDWEEVIKAKIAHPNIPMIAIVNPSSGSGLEINPEILKGVRKMQSVGIKVIGYVPTGYSWRSRDDVVAEIENYNKWYGTDGIFFDEVAHWYGREGYYIDLVGYVKSHKSASIAVGNPGIDEAMSTYTDIFDILVIYESQNLPNSSKLDSWYSKGRKKLASLSFGVKSIDENDLEDISNSIGWVFITQNNLPNPWSGMPSYFEEFVEMVENTTISIKQPVL